MANGFLRSFLPGACHGMPSEMDAPFSCLFEGSRLPAFPSSAQVMGLQLVKSQNACVRMQMNQRCLEVWGKTSHQEQGLSVCLKVPEAAGAQVKRSLPPSFSCFQSWSYSQRNSYVDKCLLGKNKLYIRMSLWYPLSEFRTSLRDLNIKKYVQCSSSSAVVKFSSSHMLILPGISGEF